MTIPSREEQQRNAAILGAAYQNLTARHNSHFATQWQVFALGLTAQGFVVGAASQLAGRPYTAVLLCLVIVLIGVATIVSSLRIGLFTGLDRIALDEYERILLVGDFERLRQHHKARFREREARVPEQDRPGLGYGRFQDFLMNEVVRRRGPTFWWVTLEVVISLAGAAVPIFGIFRL
jgi:hypothetical protein